MDRQKVDQRAPHQVMRITQLRDHPVRMLVVFGTPLVFATTGFLHLLAGHPAPKPRSTPSCATMPRCGSPSTSSTWC